MLKDQAVVLDVAGTILRMYRVAKDIGRGLIIENIVTWELIMEKRGRALVVPQIDLDLLGSWRPESSIGDLIKGQDDAVEISCSSSPISKELALDILRCSRAKVADLQEVNGAVRAKCPENYQTSGIIVDEDLREVTHTIGTGGAPFPRLREVLRDLECYGADVYFASGDSMQSLSYLQDFGIDLHRIFPVADPRQKQEIVVRLKERYRRVIMVGDGLNDLYALRAADTGVLTVQQDSHPAQCLFDAADRIIEDIMQLPEILREVEGNL